MSGKTKNRFPLRALHAVLSKAVEAIPPQVEGFMLTAGSDYLKQRAIEAITHNDSRLALVLLALSVHNVPAVEPITPAGPGLTGG